MKVKTWITMRVRFGFISNDLGSLRSPLQSNHSPAPRPTTTKTLIMGCLSARPTTSQTMRIQCLIMKCYVGVRNQLAPPPSPCNIIHVKFKMLLDDPYWYIYHLCLVWVHHLLQSTTFTPNFHSLQMLQMLMLQMLLPANVPLSPKHYHHPQVPQPTNVIDVGSH